MRASIICNKIENRIKTQGVACHLVCTKDFETCEKFGKSEATRNPMPFTQF